MCIFVGPRKHVDLLEQFRTLLATLTQQYIRAEAGADSGKPGGVRHDPQRVMGKNVNVVHFTRDTIE